MVVKNKKDKNAQVYESKQYFSMPNPQVGG
jgi:hypothetical protein